MKLIFQRPHLSLTYMPEIELPNFTILTGVNGVGKSHLLQALQNGAIHVDMAHNGGEGIKYYDFNTLSPQGEPDFDPSTIRQEQRNLFNNVQNYLQNQNGFGLLYQTARNIGISGHSAADLDFILQASQEELAAKTTTLGPQSWNARAQLDVAIENAANQIYNYVGTDAAAQLKRLVNNNSKMLFKLKQSDIGPRSTIVWGQTQMFQQAFGRLFVAYREAYQLNRLAQLEKAEKDPTVHALSNEEFVRNFGPAPWDFVNASLQAAGMDFAIDAPNMFDMGAYRPTLRKINSDAEISFGGLSSGERVIISFAFAVYYARDPRQITSKPRLLLLDEIDAPLHPSMCKNVLSTIEQVIVKQYDIKVIMVTHSPSTVALAPEEALYVMRPNENGVHKSTKDAALQDLTAGVPTLSLSFDGRRQIFVESPTDVDVYQGAYNALKIFVKSDLIPVFIGTGTKGSNGSDVNTGCAIVRKIVADLQEAGSKHIFGLIDWDGKASQEGNVHVLAEGERNGLESVIYDPLLILHSVVRYIGKECVPFDWPGDFTYLDTRDMDKTSLQLAIDAVQALVLGRPRSASMPAQYTGGFSLLIDSEYILMDDHKLHDLVVKAFPRFRQCGGGRAGGLMKWIVGTILPERRNHVPLCLVNTFNRILS